MQRKKKNNLPQLIFSVIAATLLLTVAVFSVISAVNTSLPSGSSNGTSAESSNELPPSSLPSSDISYPDESEIEDPEMPSSTVVSRPPNLIAKPPAPYSFKPRYAIIYEPLTDTVHFEKEIDKQISPASTAKLVTALVALNYLSPETVITVGEERLLVERDASVLGLSVGDTLTVNELIIALMVSSGGDAAYTLAVNVAKAADTEGTLTDPLMQLEYFMSLVNAYAEENGFADCHFVTPDGYDAEGQYVTVASLARIAAKAMENEVLRAAITTRAYTFTFTTTAKTKTAYNTNKLLRETSKYYSPVVTGIKTGTTGDAGNCLVADAYVNGRYFIIITMKQRTDEYRYKDILTMIEMCKELPEVEIPDTPSDIPSDIPSETPSDIPSDIPSDVPSDTPSQDISSEPSSDIPSDIPSENESTSSEESSSDIQQNESSEADENVTSVPAE
ncbi:MAG: D-alanyl-D-alanine carboxypeptidase [Clostridia bacterium]|nr:D-alanyl-D-alanine carboxypeptidase [Clostridia bacterium]